MNRELTQYLDSNNLLDPSQHGFRSCHSTESALIMATEEIRRQVDGRGRAILILLDLSAAFDTVNHTVLVRRLKALGIRGTALALLASFLACREQSILWDNLTPSISHAGCCRDRPYHPLDLTSMSLPWPESSESMVSLWSHMWMILSLLYPYLNIRRLLPSASIPV